MANNILLLGALAALAWVFVSGSSLATEPPGERPAAPRVAGTDASPTQPMTTSRVPVVETRRAPVPLVRPVRPPSATGASVDTPVAPTAPAEQQTQEELDRKAARAAVELDGY